MQKFTINRDNDQLVFNTRKKIKLVHVLKITKTRLIKKVNDFSKKFVKNENKETFFNFVKNNSKKFRKQSRQKL